MFAPEILADERDVRLHFLFRQKSPAENRMHSDGVEIIGGCVRAAELHRIALSGEDVACPGVGGETRENILPVAKMPVTRDRHRELRQAALFRLGLKNYELVRLLERQAFEEEVVD